MSTARARVADLQQQLQRAQADLLVEEREQTARRLEEVEHNLEKANARYEELIQQHATAEAEVAAKQGVVLAFLKRRSEILAQKPAAFDTLPDAPRCVRWGKLFDEVEQELNHAIEDRDSSAARGPNLNEIADLESPVGTRARLEYEKQNLTNRLQGVRNGWEGGVSEVR